jgi:oligopeptide transport system substrate-binding protein
MKNKRLSLLIGMLVVASMVLGACTTPTPQIVERTVVVTEIVTEQGETIIVTQVVEVPVEVPAEVVAPEAPVTLNWNWGTEPPTADPSLATDTTSVDLVGNIFVGLTKFDPVDGEVIPYLATEWDLLKTTKANRSGPSTCATISPGSTTTRSPVRPSRSPTMTATRAS